MRIWFEGGMEMNPTVQIVDSINTAGQTRLDVEGKNKPHVAKWSSTCAIVTSATNSILDRIMQMIDSVPIAL